MKTSNLIPILTLLCPTLLVHAEGQDRGFADLVKKVGGGVVNISTFARPKMPPRGFSNGMPGRGGPGAGPGGDPFRDFFEDFFGGRLPGPGPGANPPDAPPAPQKPQPFALGTGFIIDESGLILTNHHVIGGAEEVKIQLGENDDFTPAEIIGRDPELDVALLSIKVKDKLTPIPLGDSDRIEVGEPVLAIGNPLGYGHSVTHGILSAKERKAPELRLAKYLQTDASINPGNSGGPLINMKGEVIGINNAIDARAQGIGFAIPINLVKQILPQLKTKGSVSRGYLGISVGEFNEEMAAQLNLPKGVKGVLVAEVLPGEAAQKAGLKPYDVITSVNGQSVDSPLDLTSRITAVKVGDSAEVKFYRKGIEKTLKIKVGERPNGVTAGKSGGRPGSRPEKEKGVEESPLKAWGFEAEEGASKEVQVTELYYGKAASESGLQRGDIVVDVAGQEIHSVPELESALGSVKGKSVMIRVKRQGPGGESGILVLVLKKD